MTRVRSLITLAAAAGIFIAGLFIGFQLLTASAETADPGPTCKDRTIAKGAKLTSNLVTVNVFNASKRAGLANRVTIDLQRRNFLAGDPGNSTSAVKPDEVTILTDYPNDPRARLVAEQFKGKVSYAKPDVTVDEGIIVLLGDDVDEHLKDKAPAEIVTDRPVTVCLPIIQLP